MADSYLQPVNNHFDLEDVDDDIFLSNSRTHSRLSETGAVGGVGAGAGRASAASRRGYSTNPFEEDSTPTNSQQQTYAERRREIENRTLDSTQKSLGLLYETEEVGKATAIELAKQREQLERTSRNLDEINTTLRFSQRHLNGLKSVFGGLKNYLSGNRGEAQSQSPRMSNSGSGSNLSQQASGAASSSTAFEQERRDVPSPATSPTERYDSHPISRIRGDSSYQSQQQQQKLQQSNPFQAQLESNLEEMCDNLSRLKYLATDLGTEIESQNTLLDDMNYKIEDVDIKMGKQNKEINKLLGKK